MCLSCEFSTNLEAILERMDVLAMMQTVFHNSNLLITRSLYRAFLPSVCCVCCLFRLDEKACTHTWRICDGIVNLFFTKMAAFLDTFEVLFTCKALHCDGRHEEQQEWLAFAERALVRKPWQKLPYDFEPLPHILFSCFCTVRFSFALHLNKP